MSIARQPLYGTSISLISDTKMVISKKSRVKVRKIKIRWKRIFRPIRIFKQKLSYWFYRLLGTFTLLSLLLFIGFKIDNAGGLNLDPSTEDFLAWLGGGIYISAFLGLLASTLTAPIVYTVRLFKELKWKKRFLKCYKFKSR